MKFKLSENSLLKSSKHGGHALQNQSFVFLFQSTLWRYFEIKIIKFILTRKKVFLFKNTVPFLIDYANILTDGSKAGELKK